MTKRFVFLVVIFMRAILRPLAADPAVVTIVARDPEAIEADFARGKADWDKLGVFELRRTGDTIGDLYSTHS